MKKSEHPKNFGYPDFDVGLTPSSPLSMYIQIRFLMLFSDVCRCMRKFENV